MFFLCTTSERIRIWGKPDICFLSVQSIYASIEGPVVLFQSLPRRNEATTQAITYSQLPITDYRSGQPTLKPLYYLDVYLWCYVQMYW